MLEKIINENLNKLGLQLLFWNELNGSEGMWIVATIDNGDARSLHFDLRSVIERYLSEEVN